jgi:hypothetical protein
MQLSRHHKVALTAAVVTSAIALTDAITHGLTGDNPFSDESDLAPAVLALVDVIHGLTYVALAVVLVREAARFRSVNRVARAARWVVMASLVTLAIGFILLAPVISWREAYDTPLYDAFGMVGGPAFFGLIFGSLALGLALARDRRLGVGARVLLLMLPVFGGMMLLAWLAPAWAHPAYLETTLQLGLALLGVDAARPGRLPGLTTPDFDRVR